MCDLILNRRFAKDTTIATMFCIESDRLSGPVRSRRRSPAILDAIDPIPVSLI
jgi:hypothetical protein